MQLDRDVVTCEPGAEVDEGVAAVVPAEDEVGGRAVGVADVVVYRVDQRDVVGQPGQRHGGDRQSEQGGQVQSQSASRSGERSERDARTPPCWRTWCCER